MAKSSSASLDELFDKIEKLSKGQRIAICVGVIVIIGALFFFLSYKGSFEEIGKKEKALNKVKKELVKAKSEAGRLEALIKEYRQNEENFEEAKRSLPDEKQIPLLLASVTQAGLVSGLEFLKFTPKGENDLGFYSEIPVVMDVVGRYQNFIQFAHKVSKLSRIVNLKSIKMKWVPSTKVLITNCEARTYRFNENAG